MSNTTGQLQAGDTIYRNGRAIKIDAVTPRNYLIGTGRDPIRIPRNHPVDQGFQYAPQHGSASRFFLSREAQERDILNGVGNKYSDLFTSVEKALSAASKDGDYAKIRQVLDLLGIKPFDL